MVVFFLVFIGSSIAFVIVWFTNTYNESIVEVRLFNIYLFSQISEDILILT